MSIANDIASLESEVEILRSGNASAERELSLLRFENDQLKLANERLRSERDHQMRKATGLRVLLDQAGTSLVHGLQKFNEQNKEAQAESLGVGDGQSAKFLGAPTYGE